VYSTATTTFSGALTYLNGNVTCNTASGSVAGCLSTTDWSSFNGRLSTSSAQILFNAGLAFSTTSANYWSSLGLGFSTTSNNYYTSVGLSFSTTSENYYKSVNNFFSTTSAAYFSSLGLAFSTTSADYWQTTKWFNTYPFPGGATSSLVTFNGGATIANSLTLSGITGSTQCLTVNSSGVVSGTGAVCGGGGGSGLSPFSTTTSNVSGQLIVYPNNSATDILAIGSNSTTSAEFFVDPNVPQLSWQGYNIATTTTVCKQKGACQFQTIQAALNSGALNIFFKNGTYSEQRS